MNYQDIIAYNNEQPIPWQEICQVLMREINAALPEATAKIYHANPVWFLDNNPIVGYDLATDHVNLLFWSGQSFDEPELEPKGTFKAAGTTYNSVADIDAKILARWLKKSEIIQWDYKNIRQNKGNLNRI